MPQRSKKKSHRNKVSFGKRIEYYIIGQMLKEGLDVYVPLVDDRKVDAIVRRKDGTFAEVQIKAKSKDIKEPYLFADISLPKKIGKNYFFIFYVEKKNYFVTLPLRKFNKIATKNKRGRNKGKYNITLSEEIINKNKIEINSFNVILKKTTTKK